MTEPDFAQACMELFLANGRGHSMAEVRAHLGVPVEEMRRLLLWCAQTRAGAPNGTIAHVDRLSGTQVYLPTHWALRDRIISPVP